MNPTEIVSVIYNVPHDIPLEWQIATYFFLTGLSAASFLLSALAYVFGMAQFKPAGRIGAVLAPIVLIIAPLFLIIDLEQPFRFVNLLYMWNFRSPVTWGTFLLTLYPINCLVYLYFIHRAEGTTTLHPEATQNVKRMALQPIAGASQAAVPGETHPGARMWMRFFGTLGIPLAIMVHGYTGFIV